MRKLSITLTIVCVVINLISMLLFSFTFFDAEEVIFKTTNDNQNVETDNRLTNDVKYKRIDDFCGRKLWSKTSKPLFNKLVLVVIDALRADFIPSIDNRNYEKNINVKNRMPFTESVMKTNGMGLVSICSTPTVTMPRIKALISGTVPSFMDFIMNLSAYKFNGENLVENAFKAHKRIVFYGDETWIHLLPKNVFHRYNGTSSFFATDYTEVDSNVTYNVDKELKQLHDWDLMIMHYLGVDHIGHSHGGYNSNLMPKKLLEMDRVVQNIYESVSNNKESEPYLIVITGDHGMTDIGNHGGNTPEETDTALVFLSTHKTITNSFNINNNNNNKKAERVLQVDIASTLSALLGLSLPNKSRGKVILSVFNALNMKSDEQLCHLFFNAIQMNGLVDPELSSKHKKVIEEAFELHLSLIANVSSDTKSTVESYNSYINLIQTELLTQSTKRSIFSLLNLSVILVIISCFGLLYIEFQNRHSVIFTKVKDFQTVFAFMCLILNCLFLLSTSYIESEHYYCYFMTSTFTAIHLGTAVRNYCKTAPNSSLNDPFSTLHENNLFKVLSSLLVLVILRISNYWNLLFAYDIGEWLMKSENKRILSALVISSLIVISYLMSTKRFGKQQCFLISGLVCVYLYRSGVGTVSSFRIPWFPNISPTIRANLVFIIVGLIISETLFKKLRIDLNWYFLDHILPESWIKSLNTEPNSGLILRTFCTVWILLSALFNKVHNIPLLAINIFVEKLVNYAIRPKDDSYKLYLAVTYLCFAESAFYSAGNSNTLSTIDVSPAFIGLGSYQPFLAGLFMIINIYSLYVFWILMLFIRLKDCKLVMFANTKLFSIINLLLITRFITVAFDMFVTIALQNHLFIWSVLCPKFLYEAVITLVYEIILLFVVFNNIID